MRYIKEFREGEHVRDIYLCKNIINAVTKNGKDYMNVTLQDKTGTIEAKVWDPNDAGIEDFEKLDYIEVTGDVNLFNNAFQLKVSRIRKAREGEYEQGDYLPVSERDNGEMYEELKEIIAGIENPFYHALLEKLFIEDTDLTRKFRFSSAAKTMHHGFVGGLMEHTLSVTRLCEYYCKAYPFLKRDLLLTAALCHDIGKTKEIAPFPENDYTDEGQLLGHIVMGAQMVADLAAQIPDFPPLLLRELQHCILAHHGKYEFGSPKLPALAEAMALNFADDTDAKMEMFKELLEGNAQNKGWFGYNRVFESNVRATQGAE